MFKNRFNWLKKTIYFLLVSIIALPISLLGTEAEKALAAASEGDVIINEVMWMGSTKSSVDEWIELRNTTMSDIDISGWIIKGAAANNGDLTIPANQIISANGYYLISNYDKNHDNSALDVDINWPTSDISLSNSELRLTLYDNGNPSGIIDTAGYGNAPPAGDNANKYSMERSNPPGGALDQNWHNANNRQGFDSGVIDRGTPGTENSDPNVNVSEPTNNTISPGSPSKDNTPAVTGEVNPLGVNSVEMILDNGVTKTLLSDTDVSIGNYEITPGTGLADGTYDIVVVARNAEGLFSETLSVVNNYLIDTQAPVLTGSSPANGETLTISPTQIAATFAEDDSGIDESGLSMTINGNPVASSYDNASKTLTYVIPTALSSGTYTVEITGLKDLAGNVASPNPSFQFTVAIPPVAPPSSEITNPDGHTRLSEFNLEVQTSENTTGFYLYYNKDGKGWTRYGDLYSVANPNVRTYITFRSKDALGDGNYGFYTRAVDKNNNMEGEPAFPDLNVTVDTNPPAIPVGYMVPGSPSMDSTPTAMGEISADTYRVWLEITSHATGEKIIVNGSLIDNKRYEATPNAEQALADGAYQIIAFAEDKLGNGSMYVIATDYVIDTIGAEVPAGLKAVGGAGEVYLEWQAMEGISNYLLKYRKVGEDYGEPMLILGQNNTQIIGLENGVEYEFAAASVDAAGNISEYSTVKVLIKVGQISTADGTGAAPGQYPSGGPATASAAAKGPEVIAVPAKEKPAAKTEEEVVKPEEKKEGEPAEITPIQPEEEESGQVKAEETKTTRNWTRIIVAISILIIAIGVGTGGWYGYQWLNERGKSDTGIKGMDEKKDDKDKKDEGRPNEPSGRW